MIHQEEALAPQGPTQVELPISRVIYGAGSPTHLDITPLSTWILTYYCKYYTWVYMSNCIKGPSPPMQMQKFQKLKKHRLQH